MERLPGLLAGEPVYWIERVTTLGDGRLRTELGFSDVAAHPYERLVAGTVAMLQQVGGVDDVIHEQREVVVVVSRGVTAEQIGDLVDRYWFDRLPSTPVDPGFATDPADVLASPWPSAPPGPRGEPPVPAHLDLREAMLLPPSRRRMWTYLVCGAVALAGGAALAATPGGADGMLPLVVGAVNIAVGTRIAVRRRAS
ncbi:hypothetical protein H9657_02615 [Cellulomonas sp. Sa3CUA2]|uniref:Uncharacterized protein n=1 Tax=Cellulomonas avistercoris TaxID=2762242 RepID=A0ABR8Q9R8_9CELL|nr:hypothetical protein [Cellulomonas avistercoris]MBD7917171.1 hypothetical protein [Cellulomonas avistercoris]